MQVKKDDLRLTIYKCARQEFLSRGFENASMRTIAKKANTSLGNIYHYYASKDALLDEMMERALCNVSNLLKAHLELNVRIHSIDEIDTVLDQAEDSDVFGLTCLLEAEVVIFIKQDLLRYREQKEEFLGAFRQHVAWHLNLDNPDEHFITLILNMFIEGLVFIVKTNQSSEKAYKDFLRMFRVICGGIVTKG